MGREGDVVSKNRYVYVKNNPLRYVDPTGEIEEELKKKWEEERVVRDGTRAAMDFNPYFKGLWGFGVRVGQHTLETVQSVVHLSNNTTEAAFQMAFAFVDLVKKAVPEVTDLTNNPSQFIQEASTGAQILWQEFLDKDPAEQGKIIGEATAIITEATVLKRVGGVPTSTRIPQGLTGEQFVEASKIIRERVGYMSDDIFVHGSRAKGTATPASDIDFGIRVSAEKFEELAKQFYKNPPPGTNTAAFMGRTLEKGIIHAGRAGLRALKRELKKIFGIKTDISIIRENSRFDKGPFVPIE